MVDQPRSTVRVKSAVEDLSQDATHPVWRLYEGVTVAHQGPGFGVGGFFALGLAQVVDSDADVIDIPGFQ
jgi:hypothetical protein